MLTTRLPASEIFSVSVAAALSAAPSFTLKLTVVCPGAVGVPVMVPSAFSPRPGGIVPDTREKVSGSPSVSIEMSCIAVNAVPTVPLND